MNKIGFFLFLGLLPFKAMALDLETFCRAGNFAYNIQQINWPATGGIYSGVAQGVSMHTSALKDLCDLYLQIKKGDEQEKERGRRGLFNTVTGNKWNEELVMYDRFNNLKQSVYDTESGQFRKGALTSAQTYREMNDFIGDSYNLYHRDFNGTDAKLKTRLERERDMADFSNTAYRRAILKEAINCPMPSDTTDYEKIYTKDIVPKEELRNDAQDEINFYRMQLSIMGPRFVNNETELKKFTAGLENLMVSGVGYDIKTEKKNIDTYKPHPTKKDSAGKVVMQKETLVRSAQTFKAVVFGDMYSDFRKDWAEKWSTWVKNQFLSQGNYGGGVLEGRSKIEAEFVDISYECDRSRIMRGVSYDRADYDSTLDKRMEECKNSVQVNQKKMENLLEYYVMKLQDSLYKLKKNNAEIWTLESLHLGRTRIVTANQNKEEGFQQEEVACSDRLQPADMMLIKTKQQSVNNEYKAIIAEQKLKKTIMMEEQKKSEMADAEEFQKKQAFAESQRNAKSSDLKGGIAPVPVSGGI